MSHVAIVFTSNRGHTRALAQAIAEGAQAVDSIGVQLCEIEQRDIREGRWENREIIATLDQADAIIFGCQTYMGSVSSRFKAFMEWSFEPWRSQAWKDKVAAGFTNSASQSGDKLNTLTDLVVLAMQHGMIWVGVGDPPGNNWSGGSRNDINRLGSWLGAMGQSNGGKSADEEPPTSDRETAKRLGRRVALITRRLKEGIPFETERIKGR